jgi:hypothetical protein
MIEEQRATAANAWLVSQHARLYEQALLQQQQKQNLLLRTIALQQQRQQQQEQQQQQQFPAPQEPLYAPQGQYPVRNIGDGVLDTGAADATAATATAAVPANRGRNGGKRLRPLMEQLQQQQLHSDSSDGGSRSKAMRYATRTCDLYPIGSQQHSSSSSSSSRASRGISEEGPSRLTDSSTNSSSSSSSSLNSSGSTSASSAGAAPYECSAADVRWQQQQQLLQQQQPLQSWLPPPPATPSTGVCPADFDLIVPQLFDIDVQQQQQQQQQQLGSPLYEVVPWNSSSSSSSSSYGNGSALHTASSDLSQPTCQQHLASMQASAPLTLPPPLPSSSNSHHNTAAAAAAAAAVAAAAPVSLERYSPSLSRSLPVVPALHSGLGAPHLIESIIEPTPLRPPAVGSQHMYPPTSMWDLLNVEDHQQLQ